MSSTAFVAVIAPFLHARMRAKGRHPYGFEIGLLAELHQRINRAVARIQLLDVDRSKKSIGTCIANESLISSMASMRRFPDSILRSGRARRIAASEGVRFC
jgi:hypothetical protein